MRKNCQHGQSRWKGTGRQPSQGGDGCDGTCQPQHPNMTNMVIKRLGSWKPGQKWKMLEEGAGGFRNITEDLSETHQRWDICGDDDVLNQLNQDMQLEVKLKPVFEDHLYYQKVTWRSFVGKKNGSCCGEGGALCLYDIAGIETYLVPGRQESSKTFARRKCFFHGSC